MEVLPLFLPGIVAGGGRIDKPMLKAGRAYFKYKAKRNCWPKVRGVAMNVSNFVLPVHRINQATLSINIGRMFVSVILSWLVLHKP